MKKGTKIAIFGISAATLLIAAIFWGIKYDQKQIKAINNDIALANHCLMILEKQENATSKLGGYWFSNDERGKSFLSILLVLADEKKEIKDYRSISEKKKTSFWIRYVKIFESPINYRSYHEILSLQNEGLINSARNAALVIAENIVKNENLINNPRTKEIVNDINESIRMIKGARTDLEELDLILKGDLPL